MEHLGFDYPLSPALATDIGFPWGSEDHAPAIPSWQPNADYGIVAASDVHLSDALFDLHGIMTTAILTPDSAAPDLSTSPTTMDSLNSSVSADFPQQQGGSSFWLPEVDLMATYEKLVINASSESSLLLPSDDPSAVVASNDQLRVQRLRSSSVSYSGSGNASSSAESDGYQSYSSHKEREASATPPLPPHRHLQLPTATASPKRKADLGATASVSDILRSSNPRGGFQITFGNHPKRPRLERNRPTHSSIVDFRPAAANGAYEPDAEAIAHMKEMIYRAAAMRPVNLGTEAPVEMPKRKKVRISSDPQTVAARHRRERISERLRVLQRLVPGGSKMDTAAMLDEAASYLKFLKSQVADMERLEGKRMNRSVIKNSAACFTSSSSSPALPLPHQQYQSSSPSFPLLFPSPSSFLSKT